MDVEVEVKGVFSIVSVEGGTANQADGVLLIVAGLASLESFELDDPPCEISGLGCYSASMTLRDNLERSEHGAKVALDRIVLRAREIAGVVGYEEMAERYIADRQGYFGG
jgi:hypothetical protein